ncbi:hypothetical protein PC112_g4953 [Phytophthora cactorum]|nr:hypothetical protein PC112_g4953 [Phytophthora cactorum]
MRRCEVVMEALDMKLKLKAEFLVWNCSAKFLRNPTLVCVGAVEVHLVCPRTSSEEAWIAGKDPAVPFGPFLLLWQTELPLSLLHRKQHIYSSKNPAQTTRGSQDGRRPHGTCELRRDNAQGGASVSPPAEKKSSPTIQTDARILRRTPLLERLAGGETVAYTFGELNSKMDGIFVGVGLLDSSPRDQWKEDWSRGSRRMDMYTSTTEDQAGRLADLMQATLERLRVDLRLETRVITSETVSALQPASILSIFRWFIPERDVEIVEGEPIGTGTYGTVNRGIWRCRGTARNVIVKSLFEQSAGSGTSFLKQLQFWYELPKHPNIIRLFGGSHLAQKPFFVCEDASGGNIFQFFGKEENQGLFWSTFLQVAQGLKVLHDHHIVHDGLKSGNILLAKNNTPKISDFDCSHIRTMSASFSRETENAKEEAVRWKPREKLVEGDNLIPQFKSDVYSLGMCIIEAKTQLPPFGMDVISDDEVMEKVIRGESYQRPEEVSDREWDVISRLIAPDINQRPSVVEAIELIRRLAQPTKVGV